MQVIGTVGLPGSGKGEAATVAREEGIPVVTMGDVIRQECRDRGLDPAEHHGEVAKALREENGPAAIAERSLPMVRDRLRDHDTVLVDGLRSMAEVERFEEAFGEDFVVVSIEAPFEVRQERVMTRGRDKSAEEGGESLRERDQRELGFGMGEVMDYADVVIENTASLETFRARIRTLIREGVEGLDEDDEGIVVAEDPSGTDSDRSPEDPSSTQ